MATPRSAIMREVTPGYEYTDAELLAAVTSKEETSRKLASYRRRMVLQDDFLYLVEGKLKQMFVDVSYQQIVKYADASQNLYQRLIREISLVYQREPERTVEPQGDMERYDEIVQDCKLDLALARANYLLNGLNDLVLMVTVMGRSLGISIFTPDNVTVLVNSSDPTIAEAVIIEDREYNETTKLSESSFIFWSPTRHFLFKVDPNDSRQILKMSVNEDDVNPYWAQNIKENAFHPFVFVHASYRDNSFWDKRTGNSLYEATILVALQNTFKNFMVPQQFKQLAVKLQNKSDGAFINDQVNNPLHIFQTNGEMVVLDWQSAIDKLDLVIQNKAAQAANDYGVSAEQLKVQTSAESGFARLVAKERVYEMRDDQIKMWRIAEQELYSAFRAANNLYLTESFSPEEEGLEIEKAPVMSDEDEFSIDFAEPKVLVDPMEDLEIKQKKISMGLISPIDVMMADNPDIESREEAMEKFKQNLEERDLIENTLGSFRTPSLSEVSDGNNRGQKSGQAAQGE